MATTAPYGSWHSPISVELVSGAAIVISEPWAGSDDPYWLEGRPTQGGRKTLMRRTVDGVTHELTPEPFRVGNKVHEYGGGSYAVASDVVVVSNQTDGRLYQVDGNGELPPRAITPEGPWRYADLRLDLRAARVLAVRETHDAERPNDHRLVRNELVSIALDGSDGAGRVLAGGVDFFAAPRLSPDGRTLAWLEWDLPFMPWDASRLRVATVGEDGSVGDAATIAGGDGISVADPVWSPAGVLHAVTDETGWWNLYAFEADGTGLPSATKRPIAPMEAEFADPAWDFGGSSYAFLADGSIVATPRSEASDRLVRIGADGTVHAIDTPLTEFDGLQVNGTTAVVVAAGSHDGDALVRLDPTTGEPAGVLVRSLPSPVDPGVVPIGEAITFPTTDGAVAHGLYFAPANASFDGPEGEKPPLLVLIHGGPTSSATSALKLDRLFFTSRGIAVVDVNYRGSNGYGRPFRDALNGGWGRVDVDDAVAAAQYLVARGDVDGNRLAIRGGSAGGFTTMACLAFRPDVFAAGISLYGIADLELIHEDTHKFESRYEEQLVAPWGEDRTIWRERSPIHALDQITAPLLLLQGLDDRVVPPSQLDVVEGAFQKRGHPYVAMRFEGEGHGFRKAESRRAEYRAELGFLGRVFGFTPADGIPLLDVPGLG